MLRPRRARRQPAAPSTLLLLLLCAATSTTGDCPAESAAGLAWPVTEVGASTSLNCPAPLVGKAERACCDAAGTQHGVVDSDWRTCGVAFGSSEWLAPSLDACSNAGLAAAAANINTTLTSASALAAAATALNATLFTANRAVGVADLVAAHGAFETAVSLASALVRAQPQQAGPILNQVLPPVLAAVGEALAAPARTVSLASAKLREPLAVSALQAIGTVLLGNTSAVAPPLFTDLGSSRWAAATATFWVAVHTSPGSAWAWPGDNGTTLLQQAGGSLDSFSLSTAVVAGGAASAAIGVSRSVFDGTASTLLPLSDTVVLLGPSSAAATTAAFNLTVGPSELASLQARLRLLRLRSAALSVNATTGATARGTLNLTADSGALRLGVPIQCVEWSATNLRWEALPTALVSATSEAGSCTLPGPGIFTIAMAVDPAPLAPAGLLIATYTISTVCVGFLLLHAVLITCQRRTRHIEAEHILRVNLACLLALFVVTYLVGARLENSTSSGGCNAASMFNLAGTMAMLLWLLNWAYLLYYGFYLAWDVNFDRMRHVRRSGAVIYGLTLIAVVALGVKMQEDLSTSTYCLVDTTSALFLAVLLGGGTLVGAVVCVLLATAFTMRGMANQRMVYRCAALSTLVVGTICSGILDPTSLGAELAFDTLLALTTVAFFVLYLVLEKDVLQATKALVTGQDMRSFTKPVFDPFKQGSKTQSKRDSKRSKLGQEADESGNMPVPRSKRASAMSVDSAPAQHRARRSSAQDGGRRSKTNSKRVIGEFLDVDTRASGRGFVAKVAKIARSTTQRGNSNHNSNNNGGRQPVGSQRLQVGEGAVTGRKESRRYTNFKEAMAGAEDERGAKGDHPSDQPRPARRNKSRVAIADQVRHLQQERKLRSDSYVDMLGVKAPVLPSQDGDQSRKPSGGYLEMDGTTKQAVDADGKTGGYVPVKDANVPSTPEGYVTIKGTTDPSGYVNLAGSNSPATGRSRGRASYVAMAGSSGPDDGSKLGGYVQVGSRPNIFPVPEEPALGEGCDGDSDTDDRPRVPSLDPDIAEMQRSALEQARRRRSQPFAGITIAESPQDSSDDSEDEQDVENNYIVIERRTRSPKRPGRRGGGGGGS